MVDVYENKNINYEIINNLNQMTNDCIIKDLEEIKNDNNINNKIKYLVTICDKMNNYLYKTKICKNGKYIGDLKNNLREGYGIMYYNNDDRYEGEWKMI